MKSLAVSVFWPVWEWIRHPHRRWLYASYAMSLSVRDSLKCRRLIESNWFQSMWGDRFALASDQNAKHRFENDKTGCRIATSVGGSATGEGGDRVVVDDPHNVRHRESDAIRRATLEWWDQTMSTRLNDPRTGAKVIVMQRIHEKDLSGHVLEQRGYEHLCLPAEFEPTRNCETRLGRPDIRKCEGELLWPDRIGRSQISDFKFRLGPSGYAGQFQQRPAPAGGARFRAEWFRYYRSLSNEGPSTLPICDLQFAIDSDRDSEVENSQSQIEKPPCGNCKSQIPTEKSQISAVYRLSRPDGTERLVATSACSRFAVMDPAGTEPDQNSRPCYTVIQVWDITPDHDMLLVYQYRAQVQAPDAAEAAARIVREFQVNYLAIEKDGLGLGIVQTLKKQGITIQAIKARGSKEARSEIAEIRMAAGMIYFPHGATFLFDLEKELLQFPRSEHSDQVDALAHAAILVQKTSGPPTNVRPPESQAEDRDPPVPDAEDERTWS